MTTTPEQHAPRMLARIRTQREDLRSEGRQITDRAKAEQRDLRPGEETRIAEIIAEIRDLAGREQAIIEGEQRAQQIEESFRDLASRPVEHAGGGHLDKLGRDQDQHLRAMILDRDPRPLVVNHERRGFYQPGLEKRDLVKGTNSAGGYAVPSNLYSRVWDYLFETTVMVRAGCTRYQHR